MIIYLSYNWSNLSESGFCFGIKDFIVNVGEIRWQMVDIVVFDVMQVGLDQIQGDGFGILEGYFRGYEE